MPHPLFRFLLPVAALVGIASLAKADVALASPFTDHMVLQREMPVPIWGWADPGEKVSVHFAGQSHSTVAAADGTWQVELTALTASDHPAELEVSGENTIKLSDVLVGEVWLASGQSNMDFTVTKTDKYYFAGVKDEAQEVAAADYPTIRMFTGEWKKAYVPQRTVGGAWKVCTPEAVREFSAVGYFFARDLQRELKVPVGIVTLTYGASTAQAWIRREAIAANPRLKPALDEFDARVKAYTPPTDEELSRWEKQAASAKSEKKRSPRRPKPDPVQDQHNPTVMYNGMIAPVVPFAIRGVIWYQGESITAPRELFPRWNETLIHDWRELWHRPSGAKGVAPLPFYFVQLAGQDAPSNGPDVRAWQAEALLLPDTGMAVTVDIGERKNVHPKNKQDVGDRLSRIALARTYGRPIEYSGPVCVGVRSYGASLELSFTHASGGLTDHGAPVQAFEVAGEDGKFAPASATLRGDSVFVSSPDVPVPVAARYAWAPWPEGCTLYNGAGLPAAPFEVHVTK